MAGLQGLDRGLRALELIAQSGTGLTIGQLAADLGVDRAVAYRIVGTLEEHSLTTTTPDKRVRLGGGVLALADHYQPQLLRVVEPLLQRLADDVGASAFLTVAQGVDECVAVAAAEPREHLGAMRVGYRIGARHSVLRGSDGIAILALRAPQRDEPDAVVEARRRGYSVTSGQLQPGATGISGGLHLSAGAEASVGIVTMDDIDVDAVGRLIIGIAGEISAIGQL